MKAMGIKPAEFIPFFARAFDGMATIAEQLGDRRVNARPDLPGANSAYVIVVHCVELTRWWIGVMGAGQEPNRDRDAEFRSSGFVVELLEMVAGLRAQLAQDVETLSPQDPICRPDLIPEGSAARLWNQGEALIHAYEEVAQHHGQLELTRDMLLSS